MRLLLIALILGVLHPSSASFFLHRIRSWRWNHIICETCKWDYHPVCGTDGKTYRNGCSLMCSAVRYDPGLKIMYRGECDTHQYEERSMYNKGCEPCADEAASPVCGTNGITYQSVCYFNCYRDEEDNMDLRIIHTGPCLSDDTTTLRNDQNEVECICNSETGDGKFLDMSTIAKLLQVEAGRNVFCEEELFSQHANRLSLNQTEEIRKGFCEDHTKNEAGGGLRQIRTYNPCGCKDEEKTVCSWYRHKTQVRKNRCYAECEREIMVFPKRCYRDKLCTSGLDPHCVSMQFHDICHFDCYRALKDPRMTLIASRMDVKSVRGHE